MKIKPKMYLNMSPQTMEEGSLVYARNMKIDDDGNLINDYGYEEISSLTGQTIVGHIVGLDNKIYFFTNSSIIEYDEVNKTAVTLNTKWNYNGGEIDGYVSTNISGEKILTIAEYKNGGNAPLKHINLSYANVSDESLYSQAPIVPITNLSITATYAKAIPNGTYVFFVRYKIRTDVYTNWFICSNPIFAGTSESINTFQGGLKYINTHRDSAKAFVFDVNFLDSISKNYYEGFQLGFIITHDEATDARMWKTFNMNTKTIYFDYDEVEEASIEDLLENTYELYNVRNVTSFKNQLYVSNYIETDFNPSELDSAKNSISVSIEHADGSSSSSSGSSSDDDSGDDKAAYLDGTKLSYDYVSGTYTKAESGEPISSVLRSKSYVFTKNVTDFAKGDNSEKDNIASINMHWDSDRDPDVICADQVIDHTIGAKLLGAANYSGNYQGDNFPGLVHVSDWYYNQSSPKHPFLDLGLTFAYASADYTSALVKNNILPINKSTKHFYLDGRGPYWRIVDQGFRDNARNYVRTNTTEEIEKRSKFIYGYFYVSSGAKIYKLELTDSEIETFNSDTYIGKDNTPSWPDAAAGNVNYGDIKDFIGNRVVNTLIEKAVAIDEDGTVIFKLKNASTGVEEEVKATNATVVFKSCKFKVDTPEDSGSNNWENYNKLFKINAKYTIYNSICTIGINSTYFAKSGGSSGGGGSDEDTGAKPISQDSTLMPLSSYDFYLHLVDKHNIITNGIKINSSPKKAPIPNSDTDRLVLRYSNSGGFSSDKYPYFFISAVNVGDIFIECINYRKYQQDGSDKFHIVESLEIDSMLYNVNDNITIVQATSGTSYNVITVLGKYYTSGHSDPTIAFGNVGFIAWEDNLAEDYSNSKLYIKISRNITNETNSRLFKATPYLKFSDSGKTIDNGFYGSYFCLVKKPDFAIAESAYVSGNDIYSIDRSSNLQLDDFEEYIQQQDSKTRYVRSNFNLNYLNLIDDINDKIFKVGGADSGIKYVAKVINSAMLSFIYELKSMYKDFSNKVFYPKRNNTRINFDNTIRLSYVLSDETFNNSVFKFGATDYYNVPTDRGIIVNLFSIGNNIYVHTKRALYKFDASQTINTAEKDIQLKESEPFAIGISQVFDSEYGYGGIYNKEAGCITFDSYFFYDMESNHIFAYGGNGQVQLIDASIYKLLTYYKPTYCRTLHDDINHRILFEFTSSKSEGIFTISYNYKSKSFVSFHDITLNNTFISRNAAYSYNSDLCKLFDITNGIDDSIYGGATADCLVKFGSNINYNQDSKFTISVVMFTKNSPRELIEYISYLSDIIQSNIDAQGSDDILSIPQTTKSNPVKNLYIVTDRCISTIINGVVNDNARPNSLNDYKGFKYDKGFWNTNYFRNALDAGDVYRYNSGNSDNKSLVYGRYFILNFAFVSSPIKIEEVNINTTKYE